MKWFAPNIEKLVARRDVGRLIRALEDSRAETRKAAADALGDLRADEATDALGQVLESEKEPSVVESAARSLARLCSASADRILTDAASSWSLPQATAATEALCMADREYSGSIIESLSRIAGAAEIAAVRQRALEKLITIEGLDHVDVLDKALADESPAVRRLAVDTIVDRVQPPPETSHSDADPMLIPAVDPPPARTSSEPFPLDLQARCAVADRRWDWAVSLGAPAVHPLAMVAYLSYQAATRAYSDAVATLGRIEEESVVAILGQLLDRAVLDRSDAQASQAAEALGQTGDQQAVGPLANALLADLPDTRVAATKSLGNIGGPEVVEPVLRVLRSTAAASSPRLRIAAINAMAATGSSAGSEEFLHALRDNDPEVVAAAARALDKLDYPDAVAELAGALSRIREDLAPLETRWEGWKEWDSQQEWFDDDSPGHSTYHIDKKVYLEIRDNLWQLQAAESALVAALERRS